MDPVSLRTYNSSTILYFQVLTVSTSSSWFLDSISNVKQARPHRHEPPKKNFNIHVFFNNCLAPFSFVLFCVSSSTPPSLARQSDGHDRKTDGYTMTDNTLCIFQKASHRQAQTHRQSHTDLTTNTLLARTHILYKHTLHMSHTHVDLGKEQKTQYITENAKRMIKTTKED